MGRIIISANGYSPFQPDKSKHFVAGALLSLFGMIIPFIFGWSDPVIYGAITPVAVGLVKEVDDFFGPKGTAEVMDFVWTCVGGQVFPYLFQAFR